MPAIRVVMPNGTTRSFREGTPKSAIRRAQAEMLTNMKISDEYQDFDFSTFKEKRKNPSSAAVTVTGFPSLSDIGHAISGLFSSTSPEPAKVQQIQTSNPAQAASSEASPQERPPSQTPIPTPNPFRIDDLIRQAAVAGPNQVIWSGETQKASPGQDQDDKIGAGAIQYAYANGKGADYRVDPKTMKLENSIDLSKQIQESISNGGYMRGILNQSIRSGKPVPFNSEAWYPKTGLSRFQDNPIFIYAGQSVGRYGGNVTGFLLARPDGTYTANSTVKLRKDNDYSWDTDGEDLLKNELIRIGRDRPFHNGGVDQPYSKGVPMKLNFSRDAAVYSNGTYK